MAIKIVDGTAQSQKIVIECELFCHDFRPYGRP